MGFSLFELSRVLARKVGLYTFALGPLVERFNSTDRDLTIGGELYKAARGISHSAIRDTASAGKAEVKVTMPIVLDPAATDTPPTQVLLGWWRPYPPSSRVAVTIASTHLGDPDQEIHEEWSGRVIAPSFRDLEMTLTCDPSHSNSRTGGRARRISRNCGVALYSQGYGQCNLDPEPIATAAVVTAVVGNEATLEFATAPRRPVTGGPLEWVDGDGEPQSAQIESIAGNVFTLDNAGNLAAADAVTVYTDPLWFVATLAVDAVGLTLTAPEFAASPFGLEGGMIRWARDNGLVETRNVLAHTGSSITIDYGHADLVAGRELRTYWGCPHNLEACTARGNAIHYPGFVWLPTEDPMGEVTGMGLIDRSLARAHWFWWMARYLVLDKHREALRVTALWVALVVGTVCGLLLAAGLAGLRPPPAPGAPRAAWWLQLVLFVVSMLISWAMRPKTEPPKPAEGQQPVVEDGAALDRIYGRVWTDDSHWTAWVNGDPEPIRKKGGKK